MAERRRAEAAFAKSQDWIDRQANAAALYGALAFFLPFVGLPLGIMGMFHGVRAWRAMSAAGIPLGLRPIVGVFAGGMGAFESAVLIALLIALKVMPH